MFFSWNSSHLRVTPKRRVSDASGDKLQRKPAYRPWLTALSLADHPQVHLFRARPHVQLALAAVGGAVAAAHGLVGVHALWRTHAPPTLGITDRPERAVGASFVCITKRTNTQKQPGIYIYLSCQIPAFSCYLIEMYSSLFAVENYNVIQLLEPKQVKIFALYCQITEHFFFLLIQFENIRSEKSAYCSR